MVSGASETKKKISCNGTRGLYCCYTSRGVMISCWRGDGRLKKQYVLKGTFFFCLDGGGVRRYIHSYMHVTRENSQTSARGAGRKFRTSWIGFCGHVAPAVPKVRSNQVYASSCRELVYLGLTGREGVGRDTSRQRYCCAWSHFPAGEQARRVLSPEPVGRASRADVLPPP